MGIVAKTNRWFRGLVRETRVSQLQNALERFYAEHAVSTWQRTRRDRLHASYEAAQGQLDSQHRVQSLLLSEKFMQAELDYMNASDRFKTEHPGEEYTGDLLPSEKAVRLFNIARDFFIKKDNGKKE